MVVAAQAPPERESARVATADERRSFVAVDMDVVSENGVGGAIRSVRLGPHRASSGYCKALFEKNRVTLNSSTS